MVTQSLLGRKPRYLLVFALEHTISSNTNKNRIQSAKNVFNLLSSNKMSEKVKLVSLSSNS